MLYNTPMSEHDFKTNSNVVYSCKYHVVFCPKYRRKVLTGDIDTRLKEIIRQLCAETQCELLELEIMPDQCISWSKSIPNSACIVW